MADKPTLKPPSQPRAFAPDPNESRLKRKALIVFIVLALIAVAVVVFLPDWLTPPRRQTHVIPETKTAQPVHSAEESSLQAAEAQQLLNKTLKLKARLDNEGAKVWGADTLVTSYGESMTLLTAANRNFDDQRFNQAVRGYQKTITALKQLETSRPKRLQRSLQAGSKALDQLDAPLAKQQYETALAADHTNTDALLGLQRIETLPQVLEFLAQGQAYEDNANLESAREKYQSAIALDKDCKAAQEHRARVDVLIEERDFHQAFSNALSAYTQNNLTQARQALNNAKKLRPDDEAVRDLDWQLKNAEQVAELQRLSRQAARYEQAEQWDKALGLYIQALKIDVNTGFAQQGKVRAEKLLQLNREVQTYLSNPGKLQARQNRAHAQNLCDTAVALHNPGPKLKEKGAKLNRLVERYNRAVSIVLQSDNMTDIMIYRVGRYGPLLEHSLQLTPGRYKVLGTRSGYRDVMIEFTVPTDSTGMTIKIFCKEMI